ncbi:MFS general substrate transporter [Stipitochalara longipes BDJ]|nr:MFS general substrate transporter [Stipitochalara longipes BDJ]
MHSQPDTESGDKRELELVESENEQFSQDLDRIATVNVNNYHGLNAKIVLVYASINLIAFAQLLNLVGAAAYARDIAVVVGGSDKTVWLSQAIVILTVVLGPPVSQAADLWGRKWFLVVLTACGFVGSMVVARATTMGMAIAGEVICGLVYGSQPLLYAVISEILPRKYRPAAQGGINASLGLGGLTALLAGSTMIKKYDEGFRVFWYLVAAILAVSAIIFAILYNPPARPLQKSLTAGEKLRRLDWVAYFLLATGTVLFVLALSWAENPYPWQSAAILAPLLIGAAILGALVVHQTMFKKDGLLHNELFRGGRNFSVALFVIFVDGMVFFAANNYFAYEMGVLFETDPFRVGLRFGITFIASMASSIMIAVFSSITNHIRAPIILSFAMFIVFNACMASVGPSSSIAAWVYPAILGLGIGWSLTCLVTVAQLSTPPSLIAITTGLLIAVRSLGGSIGLAIFTAIFNTALAKKLGPGIAKAVIPLGLAPVNIEAFITALANNDESALMTIPGVTPQIIGAGVQALKTAFAGSFREVWITAAALAAVATIASCFFAEPKTITMHVDAPLDEE